MLCEAFAAGCGGAVADPRHGLKDGAAFFYGVVPETRALFDKVRAEGRDWYYADNAYFDRGRQGYFRVTKNAFQVSTVGLPDYKRMDAIGIKVLPWRVDGGHIVVCEQSEAFMNLCGYAGNWTTDVLDALSKVTAREIRLRKWNRDKAKMAATLRADLEGAWALVTHMSAAANEALLMGIPAFVTGACAAAPVATGTTFGQLAWIEDALMPGGRSEWSAALCAKQWTVDEITNGKCWGDLNE